MPKLWNEVDDAALQQLEAEMAEDLRMVRLSGAVFAERARARGGVSHAPVARRPWLGWALGAATAALLVSGGVGVSHLTSTGHGRSGATTAGVVQTNNDGVSDEALLEQIDSDLSNRVPTAMQPLATSDARSAQARATQRTE